MYNVFGKEIYIASKLGVQEDKNGNDYAIYDKPKKYYFNIQPVTSDTELAVYGLVETQTMKAICSRAEYEHFFKEGDVAYIDGVTPEGEEINGEKANYYIKGNPLNQNLLTVIYFAKIINK